MSHRKRQVAGPQVVGNAAVATNKPVKPRKAPKPKERPVETVPKVSKEEAARLLENVRKAVRAEKIAKEAVAAGFRLNEEELFRVRNEAAEAKRVAEEAGVTLKVGGRSNGMMSGKDAAVSIVTRRGKAHAGTRNLRSRS